MFMVMGNATGPKQNIAEVTNRGVEFEASWRDRIGKEFNYSLKGQFSFNKNFVSKYKGKLERGWNSDKTQYSTNIGDVSTGSGTRVIEGHMIDEYYMPHAYICSRMNAVISDLAKPLRSGMKIYKVYNDGFVIRTKSTTIAIDLCGRRGSFIPDSLMRPIADKCDALFISHNHDDHVSGPESQD